MAADSTLLAHLAPWLKGHTEDIAVEALGYILRESWAARDALRDVLRSGGSEIGPIEHVATQVSDEKGGRPDLAGFDEHGAERLLIEAKFWAGLQPGQPNAYLRRLMQGDATGPSALLFVAPKARSETLWAEVRQRAQGEFEMSEAPGQQSAAVGGGECRLMQTSWEDLLGPMAVRASSAGDSAAALDIRQLQGLCDRMDSEAFLPIRSEELGPEFPRRILGLRPLIDAATSRGEEAGWLSTEGLNVTPRTYGYGRHVLLCGAGAWFGVNFDLWTQRADTPCMFPAPWIVQGHSERAGTDRSHLGRKRPLQSRVVPARTLAQSPNSCQGREHEPASARQGAWPACRRVPNGSTSGRDGGDRCGEAQLDVAVQPTGTTWTVARARGGLRRLQGQLEALRPTRIVLEASGGYERAVVAALSAAGLPVVVVNPRQTRDFARAHGILAKTDRLDAARFAAAVRPPLRPQPSAAVQDLQLLSRRRRQLVADRAAEQQRRRHDRAHLDLGFDPLAAALTAALAQVDRQWRPWCRRSPRCAPAPPGCRASPGSGP